jgi:hypothetical protein
VAADGGQHSRTNRRPVGNTGQLDEPHAGAAVEYVGGDGEREARLADPSRSRQGHQPLLAQERAQRGDVVLPADERGQLDREVVLVRVQRTQRRVVRGDVWVDHLPHPLGTPQVLEAVHPEISDAHPLQQPPRQGWSSI